MTSRTENGRYWVDYQSPLSSESLRTMQSLGLAFTGMCPTPQQSRSESHIHVQHSLELLPSHLIALTRDDAEFGSAPGGRVRQNNEASYFRKLKSWFDLPYFLLSCALPLTYQSHSFDVRDAISLLLMFCIQSKSIFPALRSHAKPQHPSRIVRYVSKRYNRSTTAPTKPIENALASEIYKRIGYRRRRSAGEPKGDKTRLNIVSENLCGWF